MAPTRGFVRPQEKLSLCQLITIVRTFDWTVGGTADDLVTPGCASVLGLAELPEFVKDGSMRNVVWLEKKEDAALVRVGHAEDPMREI